MERKYGRNVGLKESLNMIINLVLSMIMVYQRNKDFARLEESLMKEHICIQVCIMYNVHKF